MAVRGGRLEIERHDAVAVERGAEAGGRLVHVLAGNAVELLDHAIGRVVQDVVEPLDLVRLVGVVVAPLAVGAAKGEPPAHLLDLVPLGGVDTVTAAAAAHLDAPDAQLGTLLDLVDIRDHGLATAARLVVDDLDGLPARKHDALDVELAHTPGDIGRDAPLLEGQKRLPIYNTLGRV